MLGIFPVLNALFVSYTESISPEFPHQMYVQIHHYSNGNAKTTFL